MNTLTVDTLLDHSPYARLIGMQLTEVDGELRFSLPFHHDNIGNDQLPALHGGLIGGFMEMVAIMHLLWVRESNTVPRTVDFSIDYLRPGNGPAFRATAQVLRLGSRVASTRMEFFDAEGRLLSCGAGAYIVS